MPSGPVTLSSVRTQCYQLADAVNDPFFSSALVNQLINNSYSKLYDLLLSFPDAGFVPPRSFYFKTGYQNQTVALGAPATLSYSGNLPYTSVVAGSLTVYYTISNVDFSATDNGSGTVTGTYVSGTINYSTGAVALTFTQNPDPGSAITGTYKGSVTPTDTYTLPSNHYKPKGLDLSITNVGGQPQYVTIRNFMWKERNQFNYLYNPIAISILGGTQVLCHIIGNIIKLVPTPNIANLNFRLWYYPAYTPLVNDTDTFDGVNGYEEFVLFDVLVKMMAIQETESMVWQQEREGVVARIEAAVAQRDTENPSRVADTVQGYSQGPFAIGGLPI